MYRKWGQAQLRLCVRIIKRGYVCECFYLGRMLISDGFMGIREIGESVFRFGKF